MTATSLKLAQFILLSILTAFSLSTYAGVQVGKPSPDFTGVDSNGKQHSLSQYKGKTVVLEWTNHDCPYVKKHYNSGNMQKLQKHATANGIVWLSIISSKPGKQGHVSGKQANELSQSRNASPLAVILDETSEIGLLYGAKTTPHMYIVDKAGQLVYMGGIDDIPSKDDRGCSQSQKLCACRTRCYGRRQAALKDSITRPYGCSVKY